VLDQPLCLPRRLHPAIRLECRLNRHWMSTVGFDKSYMFTLSQQVIHSPGDGAVTITK